MLPVSALGSSRRKAAAGDDEARGSLAWLRRLLGMGAGWARQALYWLSVGSGWEPGWDDF